MTPPRKESKNADTASGKRKATKCGRPTKLSRKPCKNPAGFRTRQPGRGACWLHGGRLPNVIKHYQREDAALAVARYGLPRQVDPHTALLEEIWRTAGHVAWLAQRVQELAEDRDLVWGVVEVTEGSAPLGETSKAVERAEQSIWLRMYKEERAHLVDVCATAIKCGIAERQVRIAEEQGQLIARVIRGILSDLHVADKPATASIVRKHLALVAAGGGADVT